MAAPVPESWTDQRVNQLKKLWQQGKSASEIADILGGVTRNAVIGKAHRLGLSGRPSPIKKAPIVKKPVVAAKPVVKAAPAAAKAPVKKPVAPAKPAPAPVKPAAVTKAPAKPATAPAKSAAGTPVKTPFNQPLTPEVMARPLMVHDGQVISILELTEKTCRWPIGDPKDPAFGYCGLTVHPNFPYCTGHVVMAFQSSRKDTKRIANDTKADEDLSEDIDVEDIEVAEDEDELDGDDLGDDADAEDDLAV